MNRMNYSKRSRVRQPWRVSSYFILFIVIIVINAMSISIISFSLVNKVSKERSFDDLLMTLSLLQEYSPDELVRIGDGEYNNSEIVKIREWVNRGSTISNIRLTVINRGGLVLGDSEKDPELLDNHNDRLEVVDARKLGYGRSIRYSDSTGRNLIYQAILLDRSKADGIVLRLSTPEADLNRLVRGSYFNILFITLLMTAVAVLIAIFLTWRIAKPLLNLSRSASHYAEGDFKHKVYIDHPRELQILSKAFNRMSDKLKNRFTIINSQKNELEAVINSINDSLILLDSNFKILKINYKSELFLKKSWKNVEGKSFIEVIPHPDIFDFCKDSISNNRGGASKDFKIEKDTLLSPINFDFFSDNFMVININVSYFLSPSGDINLLLIIRDLTKLHRLRKIRTEFISNLSHELKTPVTSIKGYSEILVGNSSPNMERQKEFLGRIYNNATRLADITNKILALSRIESSESGEIKRVECNIVLLLEKAFESVRRDYLDIDFKFSINDNLGSQSLFADSGLLLMVFTNLIENSLRYRSSDRALNIQVSLNSLKSNLKNSCSIKTQIVFCDNGIGIDEKEQNRVFERFYRSDKARELYQNGTGLGLSIVNQIMRAHNGAASIIEREEGGACFLLAFPYQNSSL